MRFPLGRDAYAAVTPLPLPSVVRIALQRLMITPLMAEVVEWQTRTFEGRVAQAVRVQVPPSAPIQCSRDPRSSIASRAIL